MSGSLRSIVYAAVLCIVCSLLLTAASSGLQPFQERNVLLDRRRNILAAAGLIQEERRLSAADIEALYTRHIRPLRVDPLGRILPVRGRGRVGPAVLPRRSGGRPARRLHRPHRRQGPVGSDQRLSRPRRATAPRSRASRSTGMPKRPAWAVRSKRNGFATTGSGKKIVTRQGKFVSVGVAKGRVEEMVPLDKREHYVDGISGATLTGKYLAAGIRDTLNQYEPVAVKFRKNLAHELEGALAPR
ncbi:MAG: NADH:ubiquinone oxidoreductase subunit C [Desulfobacterales bacterium]|nr:NADH:ubiquinone oxidoreductase subunit C [Desulfobacterales bacterium]